MLISQHTYTNVSYDSYSPYNLRFQVYPWRYVTRDVLVLYKTHQKKTNGHRYQIQ